MSKRLSCVAVLAAVMLASGAAVADQTWSGTTSTDFEVGTNWVSGTAPVDDTTTDLAEFNNAPPANQPLLSKDRSVKGIYFSGNGGGWDIFSSGTTYTLSLGQYGILDHQSGTCKIGTSGVLSISNAATDMKTDNGYLDISAKVTGTGGLKFTGIRSDNNQRYFYIRGDNDYAGVTNLGQSAWVRIFHANAFGTTANTITINGLGGWRDEARLYLDASAGGLNANKTLDVGPYGVFKQGKGITLGNTINLSGGTYGFDNSGTGDRYHTGSITLAAGTTSTFDRSDGGSNNGKWYQTGVISGDGAIKVTGYNSWDATLYFRGTNTYTGGTTIWTNGYGTDNRVHINNNASLGTGPVTLAIGDPVNYPSYTHLVLDANCTLANDFSGQGRVKTGSYVLTTTGAFAPGTSIGEIYVEDLDFRGTYEFEYDTDGGDVNPDDSDLIATSTLVFGNPGGAASVNVTWLGPGSPGTGDYVLFTYTGTDPVITAPWTVTGDMSGSVWVDDLNDQVILTLGGAPVPEPGTLGLMLLGLPLALRRRRKDGCGKIEGDAR